VVPIFPEGKIMPTSGRELGEAKAGVAFIALRAGVPVYPAYLCGTPETRKVLPSYTTPSHSRLYFGPAVDLSDLAGPGRTDRESFEEVTRRLMGAIRALRDRAQDLQAGPSSETPSHDEPTPERRPGALPVGRPAD
jgi:1-acyl-sn-glycerol-3-phosphate acyltransferase